MMEKERQTRENERKKREHDEKEIRFGRYSGRTCESIYQEDRGYCRWVQDLETDNQAVIAENQRELNRRKEKRK